MWKISGDPADMTVAEVRDRARGLPTSLRSGRPDRETPFETAAEEAFRRHARQWKPSTLSVNRNHLDRNILPRFAGRPIADIVPRDVRDRFLCDAEIARLGRALRGASPGVAIIRLRAPTGCRSSEIATDPAASVLPNRRPRLTRFLPLDEARRLNAALDRHADGCGSVQADIIGLPLLTGVPQDRDRPPEVARRSTGSVSGSKTARRAPERCISVPRPATIIDRRMTARGAYPSPSSRTPEADFGKPVPVARVGSRTG